MTFVTGAALVSMSDAAVKATGDINGKSVAVIRGTTTEAALNAYLKENLIDASVVLVDTDSDGMLMLDEDKVQAFLPVLDDMVQEGLVTVEKATVIFYRAGEPPADE